MIYEPAGKVLFYYKDSDFVESIKAHTGLLAKNIVQNENILFTDDDLFFYEDKIKKIIPDIFRLFFKLTSGIENAIILNKPYQGEHINGFYVWNLSNVPIQQLVTIDKYIESIVLEKIVGDWLLKQGQGDLYKDSLQKAFDLQIKLSNALYPLYRVNDISFPVPVHTNISVEANSEINPVPDIKPTEPTKTTIKGIVKWVAKMWGSAGASVDFPADEMPKSVLIELRLNITHVISTLTITANDNWEFNFGEHIVKETDGTANTYAVNQPSPSPKYTTSYSVVNEEHVITNTLWINPTYNFDTILEFNNSSTDIKQFVTGTSLAVNFVQRFEFNRIITPSGTPASMILSVNGVVECVIDFPSDYVGKQFRYTSPNGKVFIDYFKNGNLNLIPTI